MLELFNLHKEEFHKGGFAFLEFSFSAVNCQINSTDASKNSCMYYKLYSIIFNFRQLCDTWGQFYIKQNPHPPPEPPLYLHTHQLPGPLPPHGSFVYSFGHYSMSRTT